MTLIPFDRMIDEGEAAKALLKHDGNVTKAAKDMGVESSRLRAFVERSDRLRAVRDEVFEGAVDEAIAVLFEGLRSDSFLNRFYSAKAILHSEAGRKRGFGREANVAALELKASAPGAPAKIITLKWISPEETP